MRKNENPFSSKMIRSEVGKSVHPGQDLNSGPLGQASLALTLRPTEFDILEFYSYKLAVALISRTMNVGIILSSVSARWN